MATPPKPKIPLEVDRSLEEILDESEILRAAPNLAKAALEGIGLLHITIEEEPKDLDETNTLAAWACLFGLTNHLWVDVVIETDMDVGRKAFCSVTHTYKATYGDASDFLREVVNLMRAGVNKHLSDKGINCVSPARPIDVPKGNIHAINFYSTPKLRIYLRAEGYWFIVTLFTHKQTPEPTHLGLLREYDISLESIMAMEGSDLEILAGGVILTKDWIERLRSRFIYEEEFKQILIVTPPPVSTLFHANFEQ